MRSSMSRPAAASICVKALMSAPAQNSVGFGEATTTAATCPSSSVPRRARAPRSTSGESELAGGLSSHSTATVLAAPVELDRRLLVARLGLRGRGRSPGRSWGPGGPGRRAGGAAAAARSARPTPPARRSSAARTSSSPRRSARANGPGTMPVPSISAEVDLPHPGDALLEDEAGLHERLQLKRSAIRSSSCGVRVSACS